MRLHHNHYITVQTVRKHHWQDVTYKSVFDQAACVLPVHS